MLLTTLLWCQGLILHAKCKCYLHFVAFHHKGKSICVLWHHCGPSYLICFVFYFMWKLQVDMVRKSKGNWALLEEYMF